MKVQEVTITKVAPKGTNRIHWNVDCDGRAFGQIWTYKAKGEKHYYHVKTLAGFYAYAADYDAAEREIRGQM